MKKAHFNPGGRKQGFLESHSPKWKRGVEIARCWPLGDFAFGARNAAAKEVRKKRGRRCHRLPFPPLFFRSTLGENEGNVSIFLFFGEMFDVLNHHRAEFNDIAS